MKYTPKPTRILKLELQVMDDEAGETKKKLAGTYRTHLEGMRRYNELHQKPLTGMDRFLRKNWGRDYHLEFKNGK